MYDDVNH